MAESGNKKKRIARIGRMSSGKGSPTKLLCDGGVQADCNLVYDIMQSMDKSQTVMSYGQLQEFRSKEASTRSLSSDRSSASKQNGKISSSKPIKKFIPEKTFPLLAKCQQTMKYLKKNRCIPKPRAHVGFIPRPPPKPVTSYQSNSTCNNQIGSNNSVIYKECAKKVKRNSKRSSSPEMINRLKKAKSSHSIDNSCDKNVLHTESFDKNLKFVSDTDSDNEFEQFIQKHHPENRVRRKGSKTRRKKSKDVVCTKKIAKITSKPLSESEEVAESEAEGTDSNSTNIKVNEGYPSRSSQRIIEHANIDDNASDISMHDFSTYNYDPSSSSENEIENKSLNEEIVSIQDDSNILDMPPAEGIAVVSSTASSSKDAELKLKCEKPCYVALKRDPVLDEKAASLFVDDSVLSNNVPVSNSNDDEDDCIIINEAPTFDFLLNSNSVNTTPFPIGNRNSNQGVSAASKSPCPSETITSFDEVVNKQICNEKLISSSNTFKPPTETILSEKSAKIVPLEEQEEVSGLRCNNALRNENENSLALENENSTECEDKSISVENPLSQHSTDLSNNETSFLNCDTSISASEKESFNVQILSVKSLNESDIIILSDDNEEEETKPLPTTNETKECAADDSDIEIICLDSSINKDKCANENDKDVLNNKMNREINGDGKEKSSSSLAHPLNSIEDDCIILDDMDLPSGDSNAAKNADKMQLNSQAVDPSNKEKLNSNEKERTSGNAFDSDRNSILKTLNTIDFNCIKKVLKETSVPNTQNESIPENSLGNDIEISDKTLHSFPEKLEQTQNVANLPQKPASRDASITPIDPAEIKINSLNTSPVRSREEPAKLVQDSNILLNIKSDPENVSSSIKLNSSDESHTVFPNSSTKLTVPKPSASEEVIIISPKSEPNALPYSRKIHHLHPVNIKKECHNSPSDELDIIAAKSIQGLNEREKESIVPLLELYRTEYRRFTEIKCTEQNVTAGLKLLEEKQTKKLFAISSSIKNILKRDGCFQKINNDFGSNHNELKIRAESLDDVKKPLEFKTPPSIGSYPDGDRDDKVKIFNQSVVERASEVLKTSGPSSTQEVYNHLINSVCAECGKHATAACLGCAKVFYCSEKCGIANWNKGHSETCRR